MMPARWKFSIFFFSTALFSHGQAALRFVENRGQWPDAVTFKADANGATVWCERGALMIDRYEVNAHTHAHGGPVPSIVHHHALRLRFVGASTVVRSEGIGVQRGAFNFFIGNDPRHWARNAHAFSAVIQHDVWPGVDVRVRTGDEGVKYDVIIAPGADADVISLAYEGADGLSLRGNDLVIKTSLGDVIESIPLAYQELNGTRVPVECHYAVHNGSVRFVLGPYDHGSMLTIDPTLVFSSYSGSTTDNFGYTATFDKAGYLYSGSTAFGPGYPWTTGSYQTTWAGGTGANTPQEPGTDIALSKWDTTGSNMVWSTFLGGSGDELPHSLIVNNSGELFVLGTTGSSDFPVTPNAFDGSFNGGPDVNLVQGLGVNFANGSDIIVARLSANGDQLLASTFFGGTGTDGLNTATGLKFNYADEVRGEIELDPNDNVYVVSCTASPDLPTTAGAYRTTYSGGTQDGIALKMDASLHTLIWSTYFGGANADAIYSLDRDDQQNVYITGGTRSLDLPTTAGALTATYQGGNADGFVAKLSNDGSSLLHCTYYGTGSYDQSYFIERDQQGRVYLFGQTSAPGSALIFNAPYNVPGSGQFIAKLDPTLSTLLLGSRFGQGDGKPDISPTAFLVDYCDKIYISGWGSDTLGLGGALSTTGLPFTPDAYQSSTDGQDFYLAVFDINMTNLFYGTYIGGTLSPEHVDGGTSRFDRRGRVYEAVCAGCWTHSDFPTTDGALSPYNNSQCNLAVFKFDFNFPIVVADFNTQIFCLPTPIHFQNTSSGAVTYSWNFGDGNGTFATSPSHLYDAPGVYTVTLIASNAATCNLTDTMRQQVVVLGNEGYALNDTSVCAGGNVQIGVLPIDNPNITFHWSPPNFLTSTTVANPIASPPVTTTYTLLISNGLCTDTITQTVVVQSITIDAGVDQTICGPNATATLTANSFGTAQLFQWSSSPAFINTLNSTPGDSIAIVPISGDATFYVRPLGSPCAGSDSVHVHVELADPSITGDSLICADAVAQLSALGINPGSTITWVPTDSIDNGQGTTSVQVSPAETQPYAVHVVSPANCVWDGSITVAVSPIYGSSVGASVDQSIVLAGTTVHLTATPGSGVNYAWSPPGAVSDPTIAHPSAFVTESTWFNVVITDGICTRSDSVFVKVYEVNCDEPDVFVPDAFTPNGDHNNDVLFVRGRAISTLDFKVFDRWGEIVFETTDQALGWDATYKDKPVDPAVFVYWLDVTCVDGQHFFKKGNVTVIR